MIHFQVRPPLRSIQIFGTRLGSRRIPVKPEIACLGCGDGIGEIFITVLPTLTWRNKLFYLSKTDSIIACMDGHPLRLKIIPSRYNVNGPAQERLIKRVLNPARLRTSESLRTHLVSQVAGCLIPGAGSNHRPQVIGGAIIFKRHSEKCDVLIKTRVTLRLRQQEIFQFSPIHNRLAPYYFLHRGFGRDPGTSGQSKSVTDMHPHFQSQPVCLLHGKTNQLPPFGGKLIVSRRICERLVLRVASDWHQICTSKANIAHSLQVGSDPLLRHGTIHPVPKCPGVRFTRLRITELLLK